MDWLDELFGGDFGFGNTDPNAHFGENNASDGVAQGPNGIPTGYLGALLGGNPESSSKKSGATGGMHPAQWDPSQLQVNPDKYGLGPSPTGMGNSLVDHVIPPVPLTGGSMLGVLNPAANQGQSRIPQIAGMALGAA